jgi:hypothetical protein
MASTPTFQSNPYADFDPSQWTNPYSSFQNSGIPFPATYSGYPTNAMGQPIQPPPGMTLNSSPAAAAPAPAAAAPQSNNLASSYQGMTPGQQQALSSMMNPSASGIPAGYWNSGPGAAQIAGAGGSAGAAPAMPAQQANPAGLTSQQYLQLKANPGYVTTPGATVPQSASSATPGPGMLQSFLAGWNPATSGPGSGFQQAFSKALRGST